MTNQEMIDEMIKLQRAYDNAVYKEFNCEYDEEKCTLALLDEIGEFNHELKANWCWWKKTQKPVDREKALEELADVWHFALSLTYHFFDELVKKNKTEHYEFVGVQGEQSVELSLLYFGLQNNNYYRLERLYAIGLKFGFSLEEVYEAYGKKNKTNWERLENGY